VSVGSLCKTNHRSRAEVCKSLQPFWSRRCTPTRPEPRLGFCVRMSLSNEEIEACREAFARFDKDNSGAIDAWELRATLQCAPLPCAS
jgi:hypothetical protein